ncbi:hypothetical protein Tco_1562709 [Tanacetum coccineum]
MQVRSFMPSTICTTRTYTTGSNESNSGKQNVLVEVHNPNNMDNNMINQDVQARPSSEQSSVAAVQNSNSSAQQDALILSVIEQLKSQVINCTKINLDNKSVNDTLSAELERYKEQVNVLKEGQNVDLKTQQLEPKLYDGNVIKNTSAIMIPDSEETIMLIEESYPSPSCRPTKVEVPKELPKVSMVNTSLKKLKHHLAGFDVVVKERTTTTAITEGSWGFEHTKACFMDEIIPFVKALKDLFNAFDQYLIDELFESQEKDTVIIKLKERIKSLSGKMNEDNIKKDLEEIETINIELDHRMSKLIAENEHLKQTYKQLYDSIKPTRVRSKEECDALVNQVNQKYVEISDLNTSRQEKVLVITALKNELRKLKGKSVIACREFVNKPKVIALVVHKEDLEPLSLKLKNNREAHIDYIRINKENANTLRDIIEQVRTLNPLDNASPLKSEKLVAITPINIARKVTFAKTSITSDNNTQIQVDVHQTQTTNKPLVPSANEKCSTNASRSKPRSETKNNRIMQPLNSNQKYQKVKAHTRNAKPSLTKEDSVSKSVCLTCNKCYFDARHDFCIVQHLSEVNNRASVKAVKCIKMKEWKPTGKMFKNVGYKWVPTGRTFTIVGTKCPLTRFTSTKIVPPRKPV